MGRAARIGLAVATAAIVDGVAVGFAAAEASFPPAAPVEPVVDTSSSLAVPLAVLAVAVLALVLVVRKPSTRGAIGLILAVLAFAFGGLLVLAGLFGDFSGQHRIFVVPLFAGLIVMVGAVTWAWRQRRRVPTRASTESPGSG